MAKLGEKRITLSLSSALHERVEHYTIKTTRSMRKQSEAINKLIEIGLKVEGY